MKKMLATLLVGSIALNANTCVNIVEKNGIAKFSFRMEYCNNNLYRLHLKNSNEYLPNYIQNLTDSEVDKLIESYKKAFEWYKKAKQDRIDLSKTIEVKDKNLFLSIDVSSIKQRSSILLLGINSRTEKGMFGVVNEDEIQNIIKTLENGKSLAKRKLEYIENNFK